MNDAIPLFLRFVAPLHKRFDAGKVNFESTVLSCPQIQLGSDYPISSRGTHQLRGDAGTITVKDLSQRPDNAVERMFQSAPLSCNAANELIDAMIGGRSDISSMPSMIR